MFPEVWEPALVPTQAWPALSEACDVLARDSRLGPLYAVITSGLVVSAAVRCASLVDVEMVMGCVRVASGERR